MFTKKCFLFILILLFQIKAFAQILHSISGIVKNEKGERLKYVSVLIAGSTRGTQTDEFGKFTINNISAGSYQVIINIVGYDRITQSIIIKDHDSYQEYILKLSQVLLKEVVVSLDPDRDKHLELFKKCFIGLSDNAQKCILLNPNVLITHFNKNKHILSVSADSMLVINNQALGYKVKYLLTAFELDFKNAVFKYSGIPVFEELNGTDKKKAEWDSLRQKAYNGSIMHFFRSAYSNKISSNGFILYSASKSGKAKKSELHKLDPSQIFSAIDNNFMSARIDSVLYVVYTNENSPRDFIASGDRIKIPLDVIHKNAQVSKVTMVCESLIIDRSGNYVPDKNHSLLQSINFQGYWAWEKVSDLLPFDYQDKNVNTEPDEPANTSKSLLSTFVQQQNALQLKQPAEKLYADMDKPVYAVGDTIWLKLYLFNAINLTADTKSKIGYIDIINNATGKVIKQTTLFFKNGINICTLYGKELVEGNYTLRAYTNWMRNYDPSIIYMKSFSIGLEKPPFFLSYRFFKTKDLLKFSLQFKDENGREIAFNNFQINTTDGNHIINNQIFTTTAEGRIAGTLHIGRLNNKSLFLNISNHDITSELKQITIPVQSIDSTSIDLQFMPEGGKLLSGMVNKVGFKAVSRNGKGIAIQGKVVDSRNRVIAFLRSNYRGMGSFELAANSNESYSVVLGNPDDKRTYHLPNAEVSGTSLHVINPFNKDSIKVSIKATEDLIRNHKRIYLISKSRGLIYYAVATTINANIMQFNIAKNIFPGGIIHFLLMDSAKKIINERLAYIDGSTLNINMKQNKQTYSTKDSVGINLDVINNNSEQISGSFSIAVTDDDQISKNEDQDDIYSYLLLSSDLKGTIETPGYFLENKKENRQSLDELLLTQGWTDYNWNENINQSKNYDAEKELMIKGTVKGATAQNFQGIKVSLYAGNPLIFKDTTVNLNGDFVFKNLPYRDTISTFILQATNKTKPITLKVDQPQPPPRVNFKLQPYMPWYINTDAVDFNNYKSVIAKSNKSLKLGSHVLKELVIRDKETVKDSKNLNGPGGADQVINANEIEKAGDINLLQFLERSVPKFHQGYFPPRNGLIDYLIDTKQLRIVIDGMDLDFFAPPRSQRYLFYKSYMQSITIKDIKGIEVMKSSKYAAEYDSRLLPTNLLINKSAVSGLEFAYIEITTYGGRGPFWKSNDLQLIKPLIFNKAFAFYKPKYSASNKSAVNDFRSTVYWEPNVITDKNGKANFGFFTTDRKGDYTLRINGADMNGNVGFLFKKIRVN